MQAELGKNELGGNELEEKWPVQKRLGQKQPVVKERMPALPDKAPEPTERFIGFLQRSKKYHDDWCRPIELMPVERQILAYQLDEFAAQRGIFSGASRTYCSGIIEDVDYLSYANDALIALGDEVDFRGLFEPYQLHGTDKQQRASVFRPSLLLGGSALIDEVVITETRLATLTIIDDGEPLACKRR